MQSGNGLVMCLSVMHNPTSGWLFSVMIMIYIFTLKGNLFYRSGSPTRQLGHLTNRLWRVVCSGRSGSMRPSLLSLALLSLALDTSASEPGLTLWLQALTQVGHMAVCGWLLGMASPPFLFLF